MACIACWVTRHPTPEPNLASTLCARVLGLLKALVSCTDDSSALCSGLRARFLLFNGWTRTTGDAEGVRERMNLSLLPFDEPGPVAF